MISYNRILYELATKISVPKQGLYALADSKSTIQRKLNEAKRRGHVKETKCEYRRKGTRNLIVPVITIKKRGSLIFVARDTEIYRGWNTSTRL